MCAAPLQLAPHEYRELIYELGAEVEADRQRKRVEDFNVLHPTLEYHPPTPAEA